MQGLLTLREADDGLSGVLTTYVKDLMAEIHANRVGATEGDPLAQQFVEDVRATSRVATQEVLVGPPAIQQPMSTRQALESAVWRKWVSHISDAAPEHVPALRRIYETMRMDQRYFIEATSPDAETRRRAEKILSQGGVVHLDDKADADVGAYLPPRGVVKIFTSKPRQPIVVISQDEAPSTALVDVGDEGEVEGFFSVLEDSAEVGRSMAELYGWHPGTNFEPDRNELGDILSWESLQRERKELAWRAADRGELTMAGIMAFAPETDAGGRLSRGKAMMQMMLQDLRKRGKKYMLAEVYQFHSIDGKVVSILNRPSLGMIQGIARQLGYRRESYTRRMSPDDQGIELVNDWGIWFFDIERALED